MAARLRARVKISRRTIGGFPDAARSQSFAPRSMSMRLRYDKGAFHQLWRGRLVLGRRCTILRAVISANGRTEKNSARAAVFRHLELGHSMQSACLKRAKPRRG